MARTPVEPLFHLPVTLTKRDVARLMRRSVRWVETQMACGTFPIPRIRRCKGVLFSRDEVLVWLKDHTFSATGD